jgi:chromate transporter
LFWGFLLVGLLGFGGGFGMIPLMKVLTFSHHWLGLSGFDDAIAMGQITPGPVAISATFIGERVAGVLGAVVATVAVFLPSLAAVVLLTHGYVRLRARPGVPNVLHATLAGVVGLIAAVTLSLGEGLVRGVGEGLAVLLLAAAVWRWKLPYWGVLLGAGALGVLFLRPS